MDYQNIRSNARRPEATVSRKSWLGLSVASTAFALVAFGAAYVASPYWAAHQLRETITQRDVDRLELEMDAPSVLNSIKRQFEEAVESTLGSEANPITTTLITGIIDKSAEADFTPKTIMTGINNWLPQGAAGGTTDYIDGSHFRVTLSPPGKDAVSIMLERRGLFAWKMISIHIPEGALGEITQRARAAASQPDAADANAANVTSDSAPAPAPEPVGSTSSPQNYEFSNYPVPVWNGPHAEPYFTGKQSIFRVYRTVLRQGFQTAPLAAGNYVAIDIGCGTECSTHYFGDLRDGTIVPFPIGGEEYRALTLSTAPDSRLVVASWGSNTNDNICTVRKYLLADGKISEISPDITLNHSC